MHKLLKEKDVEIDGLYYCSHHPNENCECRKPRTGMFKRAVKGLDVDFSAAFFVGDTQKDIQAGKNAGCRTILVLSGRTKSADEIKDWEFKPDQIKKD